LTPATPVRNIQEIIRRYTLQGDNVVRIDTGTYDLDSPVYLDQLDKGTTDRPVVFMGSRARNGTILRRASGAGDVLHLFNAEHVRFCNLWLVGGDNGIYFDGTEYTWLHGGDSDVRFCNVRVSQSAAAACRLQEGHGAVFENCLLQAEGHIALYAKGSDVWLQRCTVTTRNGDGLEGTSGLPEYISTCTINLADSIVYADGGRCYFSGGFDVFSSTYSDFFATGGDLGLIPDSTSLNRYPRFVDLLGPDGVLGTADDDVHLQSIAGSWHGSSWSVNLGTSPCLDTGDPAADYSNEPMPNGGRIEMGFYANMTEASLTPSGRYLALTSPISGCPADSPCAVGWLCQGTGWQPGDTVRVEYSSDGGLSWQLIAGSIAATNSPYSWDTRSFPGRVAFRVRVTCEQSPLASAVSDRPPPAVYIGDLSVLEGTGVTDIAVLPVWLSFASATPVQVRYSTVDDSAFAGVDFLGTNGTLVFAPGTTNLTVAVAVLGNPYYETNRTFLVALSDATNASLVSTQGMVTIIDDDESPTTALPRALNTVGIDWQTSPYAAGWYLQTNVTHDGVAAAQSGRIWHPFNDDSVLETTVPGPARIGFWWKVSSGGHDPLVFSINGVEQAGISGEVDWEWREFLVPPGASNRLCWVFHMAFNYPGGGQNAAWVDEVTLNGPPLVNIGDVSVPEGTGEINSAMLPVWLSCASRTPIELTYATVDGSAVAGLDYLGTNGVLVFNPGITNLTVAVAVLGDRYFEPNRTFGVALTGGSNVWILPTQGTVTIIDDDESPTTALPRALNTVGIDWQTSAYETGWYVETNVTHDGVAAAQSGIIRHPINDDSVLETTVPGPARIGFWWKVSSGGHDPLSFSINGVEQAGISGEVDWERREFLVPPGASNRLCWVFHTAFNYPGGGQNAAWVDEFTWDSLPLVSIGDLSVPEGTYVTSFARVPVGLSFASTSPAAVSFATMDGSAVAGVDYVGTNGVLVFEPGATNLTVPVAVLGNPYYETNRTFWVALTGATNAWLASTQALVTIVDDDESPTTALPRALNTVGLDWRTSPWQTGWCLVTNVTHDGVAAARSGSIRFGINYESVLETTVPGPSHISFWWKVSSREHWHPLTFFINGVAQASISGEVDWEWRTFTVPPGASNQLRWVYSKDWSYNAAGQDAAWVDQFTVNALPLRLEAPEFRAGTFRFRLTSVAGCNYVLEFKNSLGDDTWTAAGVWPGNDGVLEFTNMPPGTPQRFYRIQVQ
jgi:hypothetical protein